MDWLLQHWIWWIIVLGAILITRRGGGSSGLKNVGGEEIGRHQGRW